MNDFTVLVPAGAYASSVAVTLDVLRAAAVLAPRLGVAPPTWRVVTPGQGPVALQGGLWVEAQALRRLPAGDRSLWVVPGLGLDRVEAMRERFAEPDMQHAIGLLRRHAARGGQIAAACSAVFLLREAGLLAGRKATTSWWLAAELKRLEPACTVDADRMVCADGPLVTAGAAFAQTDLMLHLLRTRCGTALAEAVSRVLLIDGRQAQAPFAVPEVLAHGDELVARLAARIEKALPAPPAVAELAREFCMSERTLARRVQRATGKSPLALVQSVRLRRARALLASSRMTVDQIAAHVGYQDATALRRLMRKSAGGNPSQFRRLT
jgi:transcriptional regulator GlxA family with amidase domain